MKKIIAAFFLTAAAVTPALASDGSETVMHSQPQTYVAASAGMDAYAFAPRGSWQADQDMNVRYQPEAQWQLIDR